MRIIGLNTCIILLCTICLFVSCTESKFDGNDNSALLPRFLSVSTPNITALSLENNYAFDIHSIATTWAITKPTTWLSINPTLGGNHEVEEVVTKAEIHVNENLQADTVRSCILYVQSTNEDYSCQRAINVYQRAADPVIEPDLEHVILNGGEGTLKIKVLSNFDWNTTSTAEWMTVNRDGDYLIIHADNNPTEKARSSEIILTGKASSVISVEQEPAGVKTETDTLAFDNVAATYTLNIEADMSWTASTSQSWIQVSPLSGNRDNKTMSVSVSPNNSTKERIGNIYISAGSQTVKIPVIQKGFYFELPQDSIIFNSHGGVMQVELSTNDSWSVRKDSTTWLTISNESGDRDDKLYITCNDNPSMAERKSEIHIKSEHFSEIEIPIVQKNRYLSTSTNAVSFFGKGGTSELIIIFTDAKYTLEKEGTWFTLNHDDDFISISAPENNSDDWKEGSISLTTTDIKDGEIKVIIPIRQASNRGSFTKETYNTDIDYNLLSSYGLQIDIKRYTSDKDYNSAGITGIGKNNYHDRDNIEDGQNTGVEKDNYNDDKNYDNE